ncbi:MAG: glycine zipper 2TM domain-containing protein [Roseateles sp.]|uniref:glycine zipper 2TM domain-containing protein n=1 Tax=Roseateles sp. TaxID=1971397 RepID=UPI0040372279
MKHSQRLSTAALACALLAGSPFMAVPAVAQAGSSRIAATPLRVTGFDVEQVDRLEPGAELNFTVWGTAGATVLLQIDGSRRTVRLEETQPGRYQGAYVIGRSDRVGPESRVHANLRRDNRVATALLGEALQVGWPIPGDTALMPEIQSVAVVREPGRDRAEALRYTVRGTPGGQASVLLQGSESRNLVLDEVRRGEYVGTYVLPQRAWVDTQQPLVAQLRIGDRSVRSSVPDAYARVNLNSRGPEATCYDCATVQAVNQVTVDGEGRVLGTVAGGVLGAVVGSQFGKGDGRTAAGVAGAVGGALLGREIQKRHNERTQYEVVVRMNDGQQRTVIYAEPPNLRAGDRVRLVGETLELQR